MEAATIGKLLSELKVVDRLVVLKLVSDGPDALPGNRAAMRTLIDHAAPAVCAVSDMILSLHPTRPD